MYGTVARIKVKPGRLEALVGVLNDWERNRAPNVEGALSSYVYELDGEPDTLIMCAVFKDKETYFANANDPEQDKWFRRLRECLASDPEWNDGEVIYAETR